MPLLKKGGGNGRSRKIQTSLTSISGENLEQILNGSLCKHLENNAIITRMQLEFAKNKSYQANIVSFFTSSQIAGMQKT